MSVYKMVKGFVKEAVKFAKGAPHKIAKQYEQRLKACFSCPHFKEDAGCGLCGVPCRAQSQMGNTSCPIKRSSAGTVKVGEGGQRMGKLKKNGLKGDTTNTGNKHNLPIQKVEEAIYINSSTPLKL